MLATLQKYIFREMGKTFLMSAIGLTGVLSTCGGMVRIIPLAGLTAKQALWIFALVIPTCAAFTLPIAALFSATITYGRMAADNEFTAVRSGGINTYVLFLPCLLLSLMSAVVTFVLFNFAIPNLMGGIRQVSRDSLKTIMSEYFSTGQQLDELKNMRIYAERVLPIEPSSAAGDDTDGLLLEKVAFIEFLPSDEAGAAGGADRILRFGRGESAFIRFIDDGEHTEIEVSLEKITVFGQASDPVPQTPHLRLGPFPLWPALDPKPRYLPLDKLIEYRDKPEVVFRKVSSELRHTQQMILAELLLNQLRACLSDDQVGCSFDSAEGRISIWGTNPQPGGDRKSAYWLDLDNARLVHQASRRKYTYDADRARIRLGFNDSGSADLIIALSGMVHQRDPAGGQGALEVKDQQFASLSMPQAVSTRFASNIYQAPQIWDLSVPYDLGPAVEKQRKELREQRIKYLHQIQSEIHVRTVFSASVLVLALLGAALGIILRGGQVLVAFGISFVPALFVLLTTIVGKSTAKGEHTLELGLSIMWAGLAAVALLDIVVLKKYLPR